MRLYVLTEARIRQLREMHPADAAAVIERELQGHVRWATRRADFLTSEVVSNPLDPLALAPGRPRHDKDLLDA